MLFTDYPSLVVIIPHMKGSKFSLSGNREVLHYEWWYGWKKPSYVLGNNHSSLPLSKHRQANQETDWGVNIAVVVKYRMLPRIAAIFRLFSGDCAILALTGSARLNTLMLAHAPASRPSS